MKIKRLHAEQTYALRQAILRPHQSMNKCQYLGDFDQSTAHFGAFISDEIVGIVSIYRVSPKQSDIFESGLACQSDGWQLRAMAIHEAVRKKGYGLMLLREAENYAFQQGARCIWANARLNAIGFYNKAGYLLSGDEFEIPEIGPHYLIYKMC